MIVFLWIRFPELPKKRELQFLTSILPVIVQRLRKDLHSLHLQDLLSLPLQKSHHPSLIPRQGHILPCLGLQFDDDSSEEISSEHFLPLMKEALLMALKENVVDFSQLVVACQWQVEVRRQANVVGCDACEFLDVGHAGDGVDLGHDDFLAFECGCRLGLFRVDYDDEGVVAGVELVKGLLAVNELERLRPVEFAPVAHTLNLNKISYSISSTKLPQHPRRDFTFGLEK